MYVNADCGQSLAYPVAWCKILPVGPYMITSILLLNAYSSGITHVSLIPSLLGVNTLGIISLSPGGPPGPVTVIVRVISQPSEVAVSVYMPPVLIVTDSVLLISSSEELNHS